MTQTILATFENGVLKPSNPLDLPPNTKVLLTVRTLEEKNQHDEDVLDRWRDMWRNRSVCSEEPYLSRDQLHERR